MGVRILITCLNLVRSLFQPTFRKKKFIFGKNFHTWPKLWWNKNLDQKWILDLNFPWDKIFIFGHNFHFWPNFLFSTKIFIFNQNFYFRPNFWFWTKIFGDQFFVLTKFIMFIYLIYDQNFVTKKIFIFTKILLREILTLKKSRYLPKFYFCVIFTILFLCFAILLYFLFFNFQHLFFNYAIWIV